MNESEFRVIPGYDHYGVNRVGTVKSIVRSIILKQYVLDGYLIVDTFRGSLTETLPVHRAVALAWVSNPDPLRFTIVNHKDGRRMNNGYSNLEWTTYSGNNYHAVNTGLRSDNIPCKIRDFNTELVIEFPSIAQAAEYMGFRKDTPMTILRPKKFGKLILGRYEFKYRDDHTSWFYEGRDETIPPSRYMVEVVASDGTKSVIYSTKAFLKKYQLYKSGCTSIPALAEYAKQLYPDHTFTVRDSYTEARFDVNRNTRPAVRMSIVATRGLEEIVFDSLTQCAKHYGVDRSVIVMRIRKQKDLDGWTFAEFIMPA